MIVGNRNELIEDLKISLDFGCLKVDIELDDGFLGYHADMKSEKHNHSSYEVQIIREGKGLINIEKTNTTVQTGDCIIISDDIYHSLYGISPDFERLVFRFRFSQQKSPNYNINSDVQSIKDAFEGIETCKIFSYSQDLYDLVNKIVLELNDRQLCYHTATRHLFSILITTIVREISPKAEYDSYIPGKVLDEKRELLIEKFFDNYTSNLKADELAKQLNISKRQLNRIMQNTYHTTFKQKVLDIRIEIAKELLENSDLKIFEIAEKVGYESTKNFTTIFRKKTGLPPQAYRLKSRISAE